MKSCFQQMAVLLQPELHPIAGNSSTCTCLAAMYPASLHARVTGQKEH